MKPKVDDKRCFASQSVCKAIKECPVGAVSYIEVEEPILDKNLVCNCEPPAENKTASSGCGCDCGGYCGDELYSCGGTPYGRIIIDYNKCTSCGICVKECCGTAIDMVA
jgi:Pyruvate/2-oxoacid:ferredoxin oxidoreductase delta subunit